MKITVIMACYNAAPWIQQGLRSIAEQTYAAHEIIVVDDASTDDSLEQIQRCQVPVRLFHSNLRNAAATRNVGASHATGDWIAFLDADDQWYPEHLQNMVNALGGASDVAYFGLLDHLYPDGHSLHADGQLRRERNTWPLKKATNGLTHQDYVRFCRIDAKVNLNAIAVRRDRFEEIGGFEPSQLRRHDRDLWLRAIHGKTWTYNPQSAGIHRWVPGSVSNASWANSSYYRLRCFVRNRELYNSPDYDWLVKRAARSAMSVAIQMGNEKDREDIYQLARPYLSWPLRMLFKAAWSAPGAYQFAHQLYMQAKGRRRLNLF